jgi:putative toxin-antitoxin system antitoxin component (TIGR02293 family)
VRHGSYIREQSFPNQENFGPGLREKVEALKAIVQGRRLAMARKLAYMPIGTKFWKTGIRMKQPKSPHEAEKTKKALRGKRPGFDPRVFKELRGAVFKKAKNYEKAASTTVRVKPGRMAAEYVMKTEFDTATGLSALSNRSMGVTSQKSRVIIGDGVRIVVAGSVFRMQPAALKALHGFSDEEIYGLVVPKRTLARREADRQPLTVEETDKAVRLARVGKMAETIFGNPEKAHRWLRKPKKSLEGETPLSYLTSETGARVIEDMLNQIDHGIIP